MTRVLAIDNLNVRFATPEGDVAAVTELSLGIGKGECLGVVGESGSGKSQTFMALMGLLAANGTATGRIVFDGADLLGADERTLNRIRGDKIAMIFQDPMTSLTPHLTVGRQLTEVLVHHRGRSPRAAWSDGIAMLKRVHIPDAERRMGMFPHELSGGLRQRVMIAMALMCGPALIVADEPTTALDVTVQAQILDLLREVKETQNTSIVLITHDLGVIAGLADRIAVMYAGRIVESGPVREIFANPQHPYTRGLLACTPRLDEVRTKSLVTIPGQPPSLQNLPPGCAFAPRCPHVQEACIVAPPPLRTIGGDRAKACIRDDLGAWR
jgi:oligopeptide transport system ATP-binding protein